MPTILHPFPDIAAQVMELKPIRPFCPDLGRASIRIISGHRVLLNLRFLGCPCPHLLLCSTACRIFPFRFGRQSIALASFSGQPGCIILRIVPRHIDHRPPATPQPSWLGKGKSIIFLKRDFILAHGKCLDCHFMHWISTKQLVTVFILSKRAGRYSFHHRRTMDAHEL